MASQISGTVAYSGLCYNDQYGMPCKMKGLHCVALNCIPQNVEARKGMRGYHLVVRFCSNHRYGQTSGKSNGLLRRQGHNVWCRSYGPHGSSETKERKSSEDGNGAYR